MNVTIAIVAESTLLLSMLLSLLNNQVRAVPGQRLSALSILGTLRARAGAMSTKCFPCKHKALHSVSRSHVTKTSCHCCAIVISGWGGRDMDPGVPQPGLGSETSVLTPREKQ